MSRCDRNYKYFPFVQTWNQEFGVFLNAMDCPYYYEIRQCETDPEENNYADYVTLQSTR